jgi:hypothetical protein
MASHSFLTFPYQVARTPLTIFDVAVVHRLPADSPGRAAFDRAFGSLDLLVGHVFGDDTLTRQGSERLGRTSPADEARAGTDTASDGAEDRAVEEARAAAEAEVARKQAEAGKARASAVKAKQHNATRGNQKLSTIRQELALTEAISEAREHQAEEKAEAEVEAQVEEQLH